MRSGSTTGQWLVLLWLCLGPATAAAVPEIVKPMGYLPAVWQQHWSDPPPPTPLAESSPRGDACAGKSKNLTAAECTAWVLLYDGTGGATQWTNCGANRLDPCGCSYVDSGTHGVTCGADGQHTLKLYSTLACARCWCGCCGSAW
jgi:hypothetical protein